ncbi:MAG: serine hydrolase domain-containing protein [Candidatus Sericytochromatia bacterium]
MRRAILASLMLLLAAPTAPAAAQAPETSDVAHTPGLAAIVKAARENRSSALVVLQNGQTEIERHWGQSAMDVYPLMSATKSVAALAVGRMLQQGHLKSLDTPLATWFPELKKGTKAKITLRHVLTQTTGLDHLPRLAPRGRPADRLAVVLSLPQITEPGTEFDPNSEAIPLIGGVVRKVVGIPLDRYLDQAIFQPLGIRNWLWSKDKSGMPDSEEGLYMTARDFAMIGQLMLQDGRWGDRQLIPGSFVEEAVTPHAPSKHHGYMWWAKTQGRQTPQSLARVEKAGFKAIRKLDALNGKVFYSERQYVEAARAVLTPDEFEQLHDLIGYGLNDPLDDTPDPDVAYLSAAELGQQLVVLPKAQVVGVRLRAFPGADFDHGTDEDTFDEFRAMLPAYYYP